MPIYGIEKKKPILNKYVQMLSVGERKNLRENILTEFRRLQLLYTSYVIVQLDFLHFLKEILRLSLKWPWTLGPVFLPEEVTFEQF